MQIIQGKKSRPRKVLLYGSHGIGKTTWAAQAPLPILIQTEEGGDDVGCDRTPLLTDFGQVIDVLSSLAQDHSYKTVIIDTLDWLERLIHKLVAREAGKGNLEDIGYGRGYTAAMDKWDFLLDSLDYLRNTKHMAVVLLAHAKIVRFSDPTTDSYDRYEPDLHKSISGRLMEWCDEVLFATYRVGIVRQDQGFGQKRARAVGDGERIVWTTEKPTHLAKRRCLLPDDLPLDFGSYMSALQATRKQVSPAVVAPPAPQAPTEPAVEPTPEPPADTVVSVIGFEDCKSLSSISRREAQLLNVFDATREQEIKDAAEAARQLVREAKKAGGNIAGIVNEGSSKALQMETVS